MIKQRRSPVPFVGFVIALAAMMLLAGTVKAAPISAQAAHILTVSH